MSDYACQNKVKVTTLFFMLKNMKNANEYLEQAEFVFFLADLGAGEAIPSVSRISYSG